VLQSVDADKLNHSTSVPTFTYPMCPPLQSWDRMTLEHYSDTA